MSKFCQRKKKKSSASVNITSLMDVLTIILIFLLVNYSEEPPKKEIPKFVKLPSVEMGKKSGAKRKKDGRTEIDVFMAKGVVEFDKQKFSFTGKGEQLSLLAKRLEEKVKLAMKDLEQGAQPPKPIVLIHADKATRYEDVNKILLSAGMAGITEFEFVAEASRE